MMKKIFIVLPQFILCCFMVSISLADTLDVGDDGIGYPPPSPTSQNRTVGVSLDNSVTVKSIEMYVCEYEGVEKVDNLQCTGCAGVGRASGMTCQKSEQADGCVWINLYGGSSITSGSGDVITLTYNVNLGAPEGECNDLVPESVVVKDLSDNPISVTPLPGEFCYKCVTGSDCPDAKCKNEFCSPAGICYTEDKCPDDGLYCNGEELCDLLTEECYHEYIDPDTVCSPQFCDDGDDSCYCTDSFQCDDGLYCTGVETCVSQVCQPGDNPCEEPEPVCDEDTQACYADDVTLTVVDGSGYPDSEGNPVDVRLYNPYHDVLGVEFEICDEADDGNKYHISCTECTTPLAGFECGANNDPTDGCCSVTLLHPYGGFIPKGNRKILTLYYDVSSTIPPGCLDLSLNDIAVANRTPPPEELWALSVPGEFCDQCEGDFECDGDVDGTDAVQFKSDFFRKNCSNPDPCNGDFECDGDVDGTDAIRFKADFFRKDCALCDPGDPYCIY